MGFFDKVKEQISTTGQDVGNKAKIASETLKLNNQIKSNDKMVEKLIYQIGSRCYEVYGTGTEPSYSDLVDEIERLKAENAKTKEKIDELSKYNSCPNCGKTNEIGAKYCFNCAQPLDAVDSEATEAVAPVAAPAAPVETPVAEAVAPVETPVAEPVETPVRTVEEAKADDTVQ